MGRPDVEILFLCTAFSRQEQDIVQAYALKCGTEISILCAVDSTRIEGDIVPRRMLYVGVLYLLENKEEPGEWYMGDKAKDGVYAFWGNYGSLQDALDGL